MCTEVLVRKLGLGIEIDCMTVGELSRAAGIAKEELYPCGGPCVDDDYCLCAVDFEKFGFRVATEEEGFPYPEYILEIPA